MVDQKDAQEQMKQIPASGKRGRGLFILVDDDVYEWAKDYKWCLFGKNW
jgi:hypothetical protein